MSCLGVWILPCRKQEPLARSFQASDESLCWSFRCVPSVSFPFHEKDLSGSHETVDLEVSSPRQGCLLEADRSTSPGGLLVLEPSPESLVHLIATPKQLQTLGTPSGNWLPGSGAFPQQGIARNICSRPESKTSCCHLSCFFLFPLFKTIIVVVFQGRH